jgi:hypothetical protein
MYGGTYSPYDQTSTGVGQQIATGYVTTASFFYVPSYGYTAPAAAPRRRAPPPEAKKWRFNVVHSPPPVELAMCTKPMLPVPRLRPRPRGVAWLASVHGGQRERRAVRAAREKKDARA